MHVFLLQHEHQIDATNTDVKIIGIYSTEELAKVTVSRLSHTPGFSEHTYGFSIDRYEVDKDHWSEGFVTMRNEEHT